MGNIWNGEARVVTHERLSPQCAKMILEVPSDELIAAGQFCHIRVDDGTDPLLRRPLSYWDARRVRRGVMQVDLLYAIVGKGTELLSGKKPRSHVGYMGPLGVGFTPKPAPTWVFVAGGVGIVPFHLFAKQARVRRPRPRMILLYGSRTESLLYGIRNFAPLGVEVHVATEDGSRGRKGRVTDILDKWLPRIGRMNVQLYVCGPDPMIAATVRIARREKLSCEVSLERRMGCALGACGACIIKVLDDGGSGWRYSRACVEGPTYDAARLEIE